MRWTLALLATLLLISVTRAADPVRHGLRVPEGFEVVEYAGSDLANDIFCMTIDPQGRVIVSGRGYIRILVEGKNGKAERAINFADGPKDGAMGLLWESDSLLAVGDGGLRRYRDADGDGKADGPSEILRPLKTGGEHDAHALRRGPDGWLYLLCGNNAGIDRKYATLTTSPVKEPIAGAVVRFTPDFKSSEIVADGFRNPYGMDFGSDGSLFTFDSDNERCVALPWYEPTRLYHVVDGGHHGWETPQSQFWRWPPYFPDVVAPVATLGRGSPTGVVCYRHTQFPAEYRGGLFLADWTFGRIYFVELKRKGSTYSGKSRVFLESVGDNGFAPTALAVHPKTGELFVSIGGRGTRGAVYRIRHKNDKTIDSTEVERWQPKARTLDWAEDSTRRLPEKAIRGNVMERLDTLTALRRHREKFKPEEFSAICRANLDQTDRLVRQATARLIADLDDRERDGLLKLPPTPTNDATLGFGLLHDQPKEAIRLGVGLIPSKESVDLRLAGVRLVQQGLGGITAPKLRGTVWEGYSPRLSVEREVRDRVVPVVRAAFPSGDADLDRELSRTLAILAFEESSKSNPFADKITAKSSPIEDVHYLIVLARFGGTWSAELIDQVAGAFLALDRKLTEGHINRDTNWPARMTELYEELSRKHPTLNEAILKHAEFGRADHVLFARAPGFDRRKAAEVFLARAGKDADYAWSPGLVEIVASLPEERSLPVLRKLWDRGGLEEALLPYLARQPEFGDRDRFLKGLQSLQPNIIRVCLEALEKLAPRKDGDEALALLRCLGRLPEGKEGDALRERVVQNLARVTGQEKLGADRKRWEDWFVRTYPALAPRLDGADGVDIARWRKRLGAIDWDKGDATRGQAVFTKASCAACHSGSQALGPDLRGVAGRFSRDDVFTAILLPSKDVAPRYRTTTLTTTEGKTYQGMVIYEATDGVILQTGVSATVRVPGDKIESRRGSEISLMPAGLIDKLTDGEIADLYAYLRMLK
jgi:putative membrane-bound dehydrogenase-like protein